VEYAKSEERDGIAQIGIIERGTPAPAPALDDKAPNRARLQEHLAQDIRIARRAELNRLEKEQEHIFHA
jgi:hypothetical protein